MNQNQNKLSDCYCCFDGRMRIVIDHLQIFKFEIEKYFSRQDSISIQAMVCNHVIKTNSPDQNGCCKYERHQRCEWIRRVANHKPVQPSWWVPHKKRCWMEHRERCQHFVDTTDTITYDHLHKTEKKHDKEATSCCWFPPFQALTISLLESGDFLICWITLLYLINVASTRVANSSTVIRKQDRDFLFIRPFIPDTLHHCLSDIEYLYLLQKP